MTPRGARQTVIAVINLKGGTTKTTTAVFLSHVLHELGRSVVLMDADPQMSALGWQDSCVEPFPFSVMGQATPNLHRQLADLTSRQYDTVVIDTPPLEKKEGIVTSAVRVATLVVVPMAPTPMEYERLAAVRECVEDTAALRPDSEPPRMAVLLTRTVPNASSTEQWRTQVETDGVWCLRGSVGRLERFSQAYGDNVVNARATAYGDAVNELLGREVLA